MEQTVTKSMRLIGSSRFLHKFKIVNHDFIQDDRQNYSVGKIITGIQGLFMWSCPDGRLI